MVETKKVNAAPRKEKKQKKQTMMRITCRRLVRNPFAMIGLGILAILVICAVFAPLLAPYDPTYMDYSAVFQRPSLAHPMGTDGLGRDQLSRMMYGGRYSLSLGFICSAIGTVFGVVFGDLVGYIGGRTDMIVMRIVDILSASPQMLLAIIISVSLGSGFFINTVEPMLWR